MHEKQNTITNENLKPSSGEINEIKMMTEFTLTNDYNAVKNTKRIELPK